MGEEAAISDSPSGSTGTGTEPRDIDGGEPPLDREGAEGDEEEDSGHGPPSWLTVISWGSVVVIAAIYTLQDPSSSAAVKFGTLIGGLITPVAFAGLFLIWSKRTRPYIPVLAVLFGLLALSGQSRENAEEQAAQQRMLSEIDGYVDQMNLEVPNRDSVNAPDAAPMQLDEGNRPSSDRPEELVGASTETRALWVLRNAIRDVWEQVMTDESGTINEFPEDYLTARYMANARHYPEVEQTLKQHRAWINTYEKRYRRVIDSLLTVHGQTAELPASLIDTIRANAIASFGKMFNGPDGLWSRYRAFIKYGLEFHHFLKDADPYIYHDPEAGIARFERDAEQQRALVMADSLEILRRRFLTRWQNRQEVMKSRMDTLRSYFGGRSAVAQERNRRHWTAGGDRTPTTFLLIA